MSLPRLSKIPSHVGQYSDMRWQYDMSLPLPGATVQTIYFGVMAPEAAEAKLLGLKAAFEAEQKASLNAPATWHNVGLYVAPTGHVTGVYQLSTLWAAPKPYWDNYPEEPPEMLQP